MVQTQKFAEILSQVCHVETVIGPKEPHLDSLKDLHLLVTTLFLTHPFCDIFEHINPFDFYSVRVLIENVLFMNLFRRGGSSFIRHEILYKSAKGVSVAKLLLTYQGPPVAIISKCLRHCPFIRKKVGVLSHTLLAH